MYTLACLALGAVFVAFGVPVALMAACGLAQLKLAQKLNPCAFALPASSGLALALALYVRAQASSLEALLAQVLVYWAAGAFAGSAGGWAAVYAGRCRREGRP